MSRALQRMAVEILELAHGTDHLLFVGIQRRRVELGTSLSKLGQLTQSAVGRVVRGDVVVRRSAVRRRATTPPSARGRENRLALSFRESSGLAGAVTRDIFARSTPCS